VVLRYSTQVNGCTELVLTKLDVLSGFDALKIAYAYELEGECLDFPPTTVAELVPIQPVYETLPGWHDDLSGVRRWDDLPAPTRSYIERIGEICSTPVNAVSVGPAREQLVSL
jgi:adenylosuccinate synthase